MDDFYCVTVCRKSFVDSDIPLLERTLNTYLGICRDTFYNSFNDSEMLSFNLALSIDVLQECLLLLEDQGFVVTAVKSVRQNGGEALPELIADHRRLGEITYEDCQALLYSGSNSLQKWAKHRSWIVFGCSFSVISVYLLMIYSSLS